MEGLKPSPVSKNFSTSYFATWYVTHSTSEGSSTSDITVYFTIFVKRYILLRMAVKVSFVWPIPRVTLPSSYKILYAWLCHPHILEASDLHNPVHIFFFWQQKLDNFNKIILIMFCSLRMAQGLRLNEHNIHVLDGGTTLIRFFAYVALPPSFVCFHMILFVIFDGK